MNFSLDVKRFGDRAKAKMHIVVRKVLMDISTRIVERSPVGNPELWAINRNRKGKLKAPPGYVGGRFRGNWQYATLGGYGGAPNLPIDDIDPTGDRTLAKLFTGIGSQPAGEIHYIVNNLPYAVPLEQGWSKQAPFGMVGLAVLEFQGLVDEIATEVVEQ